MWSYRDEKDKFVIYNSSYFCVHYINKPFNREYVEAAVRILRNADAALEDLLKLSL